MYKKLFFILALLLSIRLINNPLKALPLPVSAQESVQITAEVLYNNLNVRAEPTTRAEILSRLQMGDVVNVDGYRYVRWYLWVHIVKPDAGLVGWVRAEYIEVSQADWRQYVQEISIADSLYAPLQTMTQNYPVDVYSDPVGQYWRTQPVTGQLPPNSPVTVHGIATINYFQGGFVYVTQNEGNLEGWVYGYELNWSAAFGDIYYFSEYVADNLPVLTNYYVDYYPFEYSIDNPIIEVQGQVLAYVNITSGLHLRVEPNLNAVILESLDNRTILAVHGRTSNENDAWAYVTVVTTGQNGWVYDPATASPQYIRYPEGFERTTLPILVPIATPEILPSVEPATSLNGSTNRLIGLRNVPYFWVYNDFSQLLSTGTPLQILGRNMNSTWFKVVVNGEDGWLPIQSLNIEGDFNRLPILALNDGSYDNSRFE
ncbi:MAG: SH3 domain-containing protein [Chloroflexi bacterium]|nr:SH3 domain-containing protein [Chloroflexota bacterium]